MNNNSFSPGRYVNSLGLKSIQARAVYSLLDIYKMKSGDCDNLEALCAVPQSANESLQFSEVNVTLLSCVLQLECLGERHFNFKTANTIEAREGLRYYFFLYFSFLSFITVFHQEFPSANVVFRLPNLRIRFII